MEARIGIEPGQKLQQLCLSRAFGQDVGLGMNPNLRASFLLAADVNLGSGILADPDEGKARLHAFGLKRLDAPAQLRKNLAGERAAVDELGLGHQSTT
jgi:hypothetical protein